MPWEMRLVVYLRRNESGALYELLHFHYPIMLGLIELAFSLEDAYLSNGRPIFTAYSEPELSLSSCDSSSRYSLS